MRSRILLILICLSVNKYGLAQITQQPSSASVCEDTKVEFQFKQTYPYTIQYQWQTQVGAYWLNLNDSGIYSGTSTDTLSISSVPFSLNQSSYRCLLDTNGIIFDTTSVVQLSIKRRSLAADSIVLQNTPRGCPGDTIKLLVSGGFLGDQASWEWSKSKCDNPSFGKGNILFVNPSSTETYFVRGKGLCNTTLCDSLVITINKTKSSSASSLIASRDTIRCEGDTLTLTIIGGNLGTNGNWVLSKDSCGLKGVNVSNSSIIATPTQTTSYFVRAEGYCDTTTCVTKKIVVRELKSKPAQTIIATKSVINCPGDSIKLTVSGGFLGGGARWIWVRDSCKGDSVAGGSSIVLNPNENMRLNVYASGTCNSTTCASFDIKIKNSLTVQPYAVKADYPVVSCPGDKVQLKLNGGQLGSGALWYWCFDSCKAFDSTLVDSITVFPLETSTYYVYGKGICNETSSLGGVMTVKRKNSITPKSIQSSSKVVCKGDSALLWVSGGHLGDGATWKWYKASCGLSPINSGDGVIWVKPDSNASYYVRGEGYCNSTDCANFRLEVIYPPELEISGEVEICPGDSIQLVDTSYIGWMASWFPLQNVRSPHKISASFSPNQSTTYTLTLNDTNGCKLMDTSLITVKDKIVVPWDKNYAICAGDSLKLVIPEGGVIHEILPANTISIHGDHIALSPSNTTHYTISISYGNACELQHQMVVEVNAPPQLGIDDSINVCPGVKETIVLESGFKYMCSTKVGEIFNAKSATPQISLDSSGYLFVDVMDYNLGCESKDSIYMTLNPEYTTSQPVDTQVCGGDTVSFKLDQPVADAVWYTYAGIIQKADTFSYVPLKDEQFFLSIKDRFGCQYSDTFNIEVLFAPDLTLSGDTVICEGDSALIQSNNTNLSHNWVSSNSLIHSVSEGIVWAHPKQTGYIKCSIRDLNGCSSEDSIFLALRNLPNPKISTQDSIVCGNQAWTYFFVNYNNSFKRKWFVNNGTVLKGETASELFVKWDSLLDSAYVTIEEMSYTYPFCTGRDTFRIRTRGEFGPPDVTVVGKNNSATLVCTNCNFDFMSWFKENNISREREAVKSGSAWCDFTELNVGLFSYGLEYGSVGSDCRNIAYYNHDIQLLNMSKFESIILSCSPNPFDNHVQVASDQKILGSTIRVYDVFGTCISSFEVNRNPFDLELMNLTPGVYMLEIRTPNGIGLEKIVKTMGN